ncbi:MAG: hypothetical protein LC623_08950 [Halobacteriales archaeon]|nr:hypothetical protein [Halobacteriales archaeon]
MGDKGDSKALVYITVGALAAVGAGYLVWRYGLSEESRQRTLQAVKNASRKATEAVKSVASTAREGMDEATGQARDGAAQLRSVATRKAGEMGQRMRP